MTAIRYVVPGATSSAFVPVPAATTAKIAYKTAVHGQPGTQGVPTGLQEVNGEVNGSRVTSGFSDTRMMPGVWYPQLWFETCLYPSAAAVSIYSDNQMPVPAADPRGKAAVLARPPVFLGSKTLTAGKALPKWANWIPTPNYGG